MSECTDRPGDYHDWVQGPSDEDGCVVCAKCGRESAYERRRKATVASAEAFMQKLCPFIETPTGKCVAHGCAAFVEQTEELTPGGWSSVSGRPMGPTISFGTGVWYCARTRERRP